MSDQDEPYLPEWGPGKTARGRARLPASRRRDRPPLSCNLCRRRKLRCDRQQPCGACIHRGLDLSCAYAPNAIPAPNDGTPRRAPPTVQDRIQQLESLVVDLMQKTTPGVSSQEPSPSSGPTPSLFVAAKFTTQGSERSGEDASSSPSDYGSMRLTKAGAKYVHGAHWAAVLDGIAELKDHFEKDDELQPDAQVPDEPPGTHWTGPQLLYGYSKLPTKNEIIASIPPRSTVDRLVSRYFNSFEMSPAVLHSVQFLKEYDDFWADPASTPVTWLALLFTIMCLATQFQKFRLDPSHEAAISSQKLDLEKAVDTFRQRIVQCLVLGDYAKGGPYVLETLMLYMAVELFLRNDAEIGVWILLGTIVQLAMHMGYHRDPKQFKGMTAFDGEMRKRIWATVVELDLGVSAQMGLPRLIKQWQTDTPEPLNLQDGDFNKSTIVMPQSRPETDLTPILYRITKARLMTAIGYIWDFAADTRSYTHTAMMEMDRRLQEAHKSIPECLRWYSMAHCITNSPQLIMQKIFLEIMFQRARIVLHRRYLHGSTEKTQYTSAQDVCLDAALTLLSYQHMLQEETQPFCQLYQERWRVSSLVNHDFLLATSVLCLYLKQTADGGLATPGTARNGTILAALRRSYDIWLRSSSSSKEAWKAARALSVVLESSTPNSVGSVPVEQSATTPSDKFTDYGRGFGVQFPVFDASVATNWPAISNDEPGGFASPSAAYGAGWQFDGEQLAPFPLPSKERAPLTLPPQLWTP